MSAMCLEVGGPRVPDPMSPAVRGCLHGHDRDLRRPDCRWASPRAGTTAAGGCATGWPARCSSFTADGAGGSRPGSRGCRSRSTGCPTAGCVTTTNAGVRVGTDLAPYAAEPQPFNEIVVDAAGRAWVDMPGSMPWEERKPGIVAVVLPDGSTRQVADDVWFPNGMAIIGEDTLVVAESHADRLTAWTITPDGDLVDRRVWADTGPDSAPDGICVDAEGAIWFASVPGQKCVRVAEGGEVLETVEADRGCFACMLGGDDGRTLLIVANHYSEAGASDGVLLTARVEVPRAGRP